MFSIELKPRNLSNRRIYFSGIIKGAEGNFYDYVDIHLIKFLSELD